jgi:hypothetical protein
MRTWTVRLGLSLMVVVGFWTNRLPAQVQFVVAPGQQVLVFPTVPYEPDSHPPSDYPFYVRPKREKAKHLYKRVLNCVGMGCQDSADGWCGNFWSEYRYIYGSCRDWYSDKCSPNQPCYDKRRQQ